jgi:glycosyltransferase involved in cell wall biosynthesis
MHVLILPSWYFPLGSQAIAGRMFHHLAGALRANGIDARILYSDYSIKAPLIKSVSHQLEEGVPTWRFSQIFLPKANARLMAWWRHKGVSDILQYIASEGTPDLIHAQSYMAGGVASQLKKKVDIPFIYTERLSAFMTGAISENHQPIIQEVFNSAAKITGVSPGMVKYMEKFSNRPVQVVPNFYDPDIFNYTPHSKKYDVFTWVSVGEPAHIKGLDILFHAFAEVKIRMHDIPMQLLLVDNIPEKKELLTLASSLHIDKDIIWKGLLPQTALAEVLNKSHVLVSASRVETFGKAIIEAQACGLPVVVTDTEGAQSIVTDSHQGEMAERGNAESLVLAMQKVMLHYPAFNSERISKAIGERYSQQVVVSQWISLYNSLLS